ncbi:hypothetical protein [uncultured Helicobacter sp.]|uniref:hypothetical protein n=1 Tax=uncultured Helicobacter sp. TaxID=175537 RepID=UPI0037508F8D
MGFYEGGFVGLDSKMLGFGSVYRIYPIAKSLAILLQAKLHKMIESSRVYREGVSPSGVNEVATPRNHRISHLDSVYVRAAEAMGGFAHIADNKFVKQTCIKENNGIHTLSHNFCFCAAYREFSGRDFDIFKPLYPAPHSGIYFLH